MIVSKIMDRTVEPFRHRGCRYGQLTSIIKIAIVSPELQSTRRSIRYTAKDCLDSKVDPDALFNQAGSRIGPVGGRCEFLNGACAGKWAPNLSSVWPSSKKQIHIICLVERYLLSRQPEHEEVERTVGGEAGQHEAPHLAIAEEPVPGRSLTGVLPTPSFPDEPRLLRREERVPIERVEDPPAHQPEQAQPPGGDDLYFGFWIFDFGFLVCLGF